MSKQREKLTHGIAALRAMTTLVCAMLVVAGMLHDAQHAASGSIESCAACPQLGHAAPAGAVAHEVIVRYDESRVAPQTETSVPTRTPFGPRLARGPPHS